jgi:hypothetical protein
MDFQALIDNIPQERPLHEYQLKREEVYPKDYVLEIKPEEKRQQISLENFSGCVVSLIPINDRYVACRIILNKEKPKYSGTFREN